MYKFIPKGPDEKIGKGDWYYFAPFRSDAQCSRVPAIFDGHSVKFISMQYGPDEIVICTRRREYVPNVQQLPLP